MLRRHTNYEERKVLVLQTINDMFEENNTLNRIVRELRTEKEYLKREIELYTAERTKK